MIDKTVEGYIKTYPFLKYLQEDKTKYKRASDLGYDDPDDLFLVGESGGFLLNIHPGDKFVNTNLLLNLLTFIELIKENILSLKKIVFLICSSEKEKSIEEQLDIVHLV